MDRTLWRFLIFDDIIDTFLCVCILQCPFELSSIVAIYWLIDWLSGLSIIQTVLLYPSVWRKDWLIDWMIDCLGYALFIIQTVLLSPFVWHEDWLIDWLIDYLGYGLSFVQTVLLFPSVWREYPGDSIWQLLLS